MTRVDVRGILMHASRIVAMSALAGIALCGITAYAILVYGPDVDVARIGF